MAGHFKGQAGAWRAQHVPDKPQFSGFMYPCRFEDEVQNLAVRGSIPEELDGVFYHVMPDPAFPPFIENDPVRFFLFFSSNPQAPVTPLQSALGIGRQTWQASERGRER